MVHGVGCMVSLTWISFFRAKAEEKIPSSSKSVSTMKAKYEITIEGRLPWELNMILRVQACRQRVFKSKGVLKTPDPPILVRLFQCAVFGPGRAVSKNRPWKEWGIKGRIRVANLVVLVEGRCRLGIWDSLVHGTTLFASPKPLWLSEICFDELPLLGSMDSEELDVEWRWWTYELLPLYGGRMWFDR